MPSSLKRYVIKVKTNMPETNDINLPGQKAPENPLTENLVASINAHVIGTPNNIKMKRYVFAHGHINGPLVCTQTITCPNKNIKNA